MQKCKKNRNKKDEQQIKKRSSFQSEDSINRPKTKRCPPQLTFSNDTTDGECDDLNSKNQDNVNSNTQSQMLNHDVSEEKICSKNIKLNDISRAVQSMFDNLKRDLTQQFNRVDTGIKNLDEHTKDLDKRFDEKLNQLSHKIDDIYERSAVLSIMERLRIDQGLEVRTQATVKLLRKMLRLERTVAFLLEYYQNIELQHLIVVLCGRFDHHLHHRAPDFICKTVFQSTFSSKVSLL
ncbi:unnamed protein product, partial [Rotaria magnacalcarata]